MSDLTREEQDHVRNAIRFLRVRAGGWEPMAKALRFKQATITEVVACRDAVSASMLLRVARLAGVSVDDVLSGKYPIPGTCPHCGHREEKGI